MAAPSLMPVRQLYVRNIPFVTIAFGDRTDALPGSASQKSEPGFPGSPAYPGGDGRGDQDTRLVRQDAGKSTVSTTWMTPFDWCTLEIETIERSPLESMIQILPSACFTVCSSPSAVLSFLPSVRSEASSLPGTTW